MCVLTFQVVACTLSAICRRHIYGTELGEPEARLLYDPPTFCSKGPNTLPHCSLISQQAVAAIRSVNRGVTQVHVRVPELQQFEILHGITCVLLLCLIAAH